MYRYYFLFPLMLIIYVSGSAQTSLVEEDLQRYTSGVLAEQVAHFSEGDLHYAGLVVQETSTGNVIANVSLIYKDSRFISGEPNTTPFPTPLGRALLYMCIMSDAKNANMVIDTQGGVHTDSEGQVIRDHNAAHGGYGMCDLLHAFIGNSDVGMIKGAEIAFQKDARKLAVKINRSGILFGGIASETYGRWDSYALLGYRNSSISLLESTAWLTAVAGGSFVIRLTASDPSDPYDEIDKDGRKSLMRAMRMHVTEGLGRSMNSDLPVAGLTNVSPETDEGYRSFFAAAVMPYSEDSLPKYTIGIQIVSKGSARPATAIKKIVDYLYFRDLISAKKVAQAHHRRLHPAAR